MLSETTSPTQLSVVIITFNEESHIASCIDSVLPIADEIIVVDSFSTDRTKAICEDRGVRFIEHTFKGYGAQKNFGSSEASFDFIFSLDADERPDAALIESIQKVKYYPSADIFSMNRLNCYCGKWIRHGAWYPDIKMRLYDRRKGSWTLAEVHETLLPEPSACIKHLQGNLLHYSYATIEQHRRQSEKYSTLGATAAATQGKTAGFVRPLINPLWRFIRDYFFWLGFLDGYYGLVIAALSAREVYMKYRKLDELNKKME